MLIDIQKKVESPILLHLEAETSSLIFGTYLCAFVSSGQAGHVAAAAAEQSFGSQINIMITNEEASRRLDQAAVYFEANDNEACKKELLSLINEPGLDLADRFNAQAQLVYNARRWEEGEKYRKDAETTFAEMKALKSRYPKEMVALFRSELEVLEEWQEDHSDPEKPLSAPVKGELEDWHLDYSDQEEPVSAPVPAKKKTTKLRERAR